VVVVVAAALALGRGVDAHAVAISATNAKGVRSRGQCRRRALALDSLTATAPPSSYRRRQFLCPG